MSRATDTLVRDERGFTLSEMVTSLAILGIVLAAFSMVLSTTMTHGTQEQESALIQTEARAAVEQFAREFRTIYSGVDGTWPVEAIGATSIRFLTPQRVTPFKLQRVEWQLSGGNLQRRFVTTSDTDGDPWVWPTAITSAAWDTRARSIKNTTTPVFRFFGDDGVTVATLPADVRVVTVTLEVATKGKATRLTTFTTKISPRVSPP